MKSLIDYWKYINSFFTEQAVESRESAINPTLEVSYINGRLMLNADKANYSYGNLHRAFQTVFRKIEFEKENPQHVLILGFGAGSVASIIQYEYKKNCKITGVEKDDVVIDIAQKHFLLEKFKTLELKNTDAWDFVMEAIQKFDLIVFDVYKDQLIPPEFETAEFLNKLIELLPKSGMLIFNKFIFDNKTVLEKDNLLHFFNEKEGRTKFVKTEHHLENGMIIYRKP